MTNGKSRIKPKEYESLRARLLKLKALSEGGVGGEAENARVLLGRFLDEYGLPLEAFLAPEAEAKPRVFRSIGTSGITFTLLLQCYCKMTDAREMRYRVIGRNLIIDLTDYQYAELRSMFDFYRKQFAKEKKRVMDEMLSAFLQRHDLFPVSSGVEDGDDKEELSLEEKMRINRIASLATGMDVTSYHKQLEGK